MKITKRKTEHYVDNVEFLRVLTKHRVLVNKAKKAKKTAPRVPEYVGECLLKIATHLAQKPNFAGYGFRDEMVSDAVENCLLYLHNFNPRKSKNPFAYFTQIVYYAFLRRIEREKKHLYTKYKYAVVTAQSHGDHVTPEGSSSGTVQDAKWLSYENIHTFIGDYEAKLKAQKLKKARALDFASDVTIDSLVPRTVRMPKEQEPLELPDDLDDDEFDDEDDLEDDETLDTSEHDDDDTDSALSERYYE